PDSDLACGRCTARPAGRRDNGVVVLMATRPPMITGNTRGGTHVGGHRCTFGEDAPVTLETSPAEQPWPVRVVSQKIGSWIAKLGWVWIDGQVAQITRRPGTGTVFL